MRKLALLTALLLTTAIPAKADMAIELQEAGVNGGAFTQVASGTLSGGVATTSFNAIYGNFNVTVTGTQQAPPGPGGIMLDGTSVDIQQITGGTAQITALVIATGYTTPVANSLPGQIFESSFTTNLLTGTSVPMATFLDSLNGASLPGTHLSSFTAAAGDLTNVSFSTPVLTGNPYALTAEFVFNGSGAGTQMSSTIDIASVPGPIVGAGLPGLVAACGALFALARRRPKLAV
jgi:hypothetical protein